MPEQPDQTAVKMDGSGYARTAGPNGRQNGRSKKCRNSRTKRPSKPESYRKWKWTVEKTDEVKKNREFIWTLDTTRDGAERGPQFLLFLKLLYIFYFKMISTICRVGKMCRERVEWRNINLSSNISLKYNFRPIMSVKCHSCHWKYCW